MKVKVLFQNLEDSQKSLLGPNIWILRNIGLFDSDNKLLNYFNYFNKILVNLLLITQFIDLYQLTSKIGTDVDVDVNILLFNLKFTCVAFITLLKCNTFLIWGKKWKIIFDYVTKADIEERGNGDYRQSIINGYTNYSRILTYGYFLMIFATGIIVGFIPAIKYAWSNNEDKIFVHVASVWVPFNKEVPPGCWILFTWHLFISYYTGAIIGIYDTSMYVIMKFFEKKLQLLQVRCSLLYRDKAEIVSDEEFQTRIKICHIQHNEFLK